MLASDVDEANDDESSTEPERVLDDVRYIYLTIMCSGLGLDYFRRCKGRVGNGRLSESN